jgi:hypothetical protein
MNDIRFEIDGIEYKVPEFINIDNYVNVYKIKDIFSDEYFAAKLLNIICDTPVEKVLETNYQQVEFIAAYIMSMFPTQETPAFYDRFEIDGIEYGFLPSWRQLSFAEWVDLDTLMTKKPQEFLNYIHIVTAIMFRPIVEKTNKSYTIEKYNSETMMKRAELFRDKLDIKYFIGAQFFFIKFARKFLEPTQQSSTMTLIEKIKWYFKIKKIMKKSHSTKSLDGGLLSTELVKTILQDINKSSKKVWWKF